MKILTALLLSLTLAFLGCTTKSKADARARAAFAAGQRQAYLQAVEAQRTSIRVIGPVQQPEIPWTDDLTLAQAIAIAKYRVAGDPKAIVVIRKLQRIPVDPQTLLKGDDFPLAPGDTIEIQP